MRLHVWYLLNMGLTAPPKQATHVRSTMGAALSELASVSLTRYKAFRTEQQLEIRPITLLFGHNSVGKSAALRLCKVLSDAASYDPAGRFPGAVLNYSSEALRGATLKEIVHAGTPGSGLAFSIRWTDGVLYEFEIKQDVRGLGEIVASFSLGCPDSSYPFAASDPAANLYEVDCKGTQFSGEITFSGIRPTLSDEGWPSEVKAALAVVCERLVDLGGDVHWISAVRSQPPRVYMVEPGIQTTIKPDGTGTAEALRASWLMNDGVAEEVSEWLSRICGCKLSFASTDAEILLGRQWFPFNVTSVDGGSEIAVRDVGEGISQALPVITLCKLASKGRLGNHPVLAIEQPELHLHPKAITELANGLIECIKQDTPAKHIIETHSESFLLAIQVALLEGDIKPADVIVHWVSNDSDGATLTKIVFDDQGYPSTGWPAGVFREALEQARRVSELRLNR